MTLLSGHGEYMHKSCTAGKGGADRSLDRSTSELFTATANDCNDKRVQWYSGCCEERKPL